MSTAPTPESAPQMHAAANESIEAMFRKGCDLERQLADVTKQRDQLEQWKREQLAVDSSWGPQEVGRLLGMTLGADIRANIKPGIEKLIAQRDMLADLLRKSCAAHPVAGDWLEKSQEALAAVKKTPTKKENE